MELALKLITVRDLGPVNTVFLSIFPFLKGTQLFPSVGCLKNSIKMLSVSHLLEILTTPNFFPFFKHLRQGGGRGMRMKHTRPLTISHTFYRVMLCGRGVQEEGASAFWVGWYHRKREDRLCQFTRSVLPFFLGSAGQRISGIFDSRGANSRAKARASPKTNGRKPRLLVPWMDGQG